LEASSGLDGLNGKNENCSRWAKTQLPVLASSLPIAFTRSGMCFVKGGKRKKTPKNFMSGTPFASAGSSVRANKCKWARSFSIPKTASNDTLQVLMDFAELMRTKISRGFATDLMRESFALADLDEKAQEAELRRLLKRRSELSDDQIKDWAQKLARLAVALDTHADRKRRSL